MDRVARVIRRFDVHVAMLAECRFNVSDLLGDLSHENDQPWHRVQSGFEKVVVLSRLSRESIVDAGVCFGDLGIFKVILDGKLRSLVAVAHLESQLYKTKEELGSYLGSYADFIVSREDDLGCRDSVLVGDLNLDPYDFGMANSCGLNAVMTMRSARRLVRKTKFGEKRFFYNPMWAHFGDRSNGPAGTYYRSQLPEPWRIVDQVLVRPSLNNRLKSVTIVDSDGTAPLVSKNGLPSKKGASDHLPLHFALDL